MTIVLMFAMAAMYGCRSSSPQGGSVVKGEGFKITVPILGTTIKQGETRTVGVSLKRGDYFKQDVDLRIEVAEGIKVEPANITIKASDKADLQVRFTADQNTAIGEYKVTFTGVPKTGEPASAEYNLKVVAP